MIKQPKPLKDLTLLDRFLFSEAMDDPTFAEDVLSIIMRDEVFLKGLPQTEKEQRDRSLRKYVRLDVWTEDEKERIFDTEVQQKDTHNLPKRSRYYQALIDSNLLEVGDTDYNLLRKVHIIMITPFDLFGKNRYCYTFKMSCMEIPEIDLQDDAVRIFLNTKGEDDENVSQELRCMLHFFETPTEEVARRSGSERIVRMYQYVESLKKNEELGVKYMQEWEEKILAKKEAREEGRAEGEARLSALIQELLRKNRMDEIAKVAESAEYREKLFKEMNL